MGITRTCSAIKSHQNPSLNTCTVTTELKVNSLVLGINIKTDSGSNNMSPPQFPPRFYPPPRPRRKKWCLENTMPSWTSMSQVCSLGTRDPFEILVRAKSPDVHPPKPLSNQGSFLWCRHIDRTTLMDWACTALSSASVCATQGNGKLR